MRLSSRRRVAVLMRLSMGLSLGLILFAVPEIIAAKPAFALQSGSFGSIEVVYSVSVSDSDTCHINESSFGLDVCAYNLEGGTGGTQDYTGSTNATIKATIPITTSDNLQTPGSGTGSWNETIANMSASGTFTNSLTAQSGCINTGTETFTGGPTAPGTLNVESLAMSTDQRGNISDFTLTTQSVSPPAVELANPGDATIVTATQTPGCPLGRVPFPPGNAGFARATADQQLVDASLGFLNNNRYVYTGWTIDPNHNWTPAQGGVLAQKMITGTTQFAAPDSGPISSTETIQIVTGPCLPAAPPTGALSKVPANPAAAGGDSVTFAAVRNPDTPAGMPDRIPPNPGHETMVDIQVQLESCSTSPVVITGQGGSGDGTVLINGQQQFTLPKRGTYNFGLSVQGVEMTDIGRGPHLTLVANEVSKDGSVQTIGRSNPFVVSAIPLAYKEELSGSVRGNLRGITVNDSWASDSSDSGDVSDLTGVVLSELVRPVGETPVAVSGFLPASIFSVDSHTIGIHNIPHTVGVISVLDQASCFVDLRSFPPTDPVHPDPADIFPMAQSGFTITKSVGADPDGHGGNALTYTTVVVGAQVTVQAELAWANVTLSMSSAPGTTVIDGTVVPDISVPQDLASGREE